MKYKFTYCSLLTLLLANQSIGYAATITVDGGQSGASGDNLLFTPGNASSGDSVFLTNVTTSLLPKSSIHAGDTVILSQGAYGGNGGIASNGSGGSGGNASSLQNWTEYTAGNTTVDTSAQGGSAGAAYYPSPQPGFSGSASASSTVNLGGNGTVSVGALGGDGSGITGFPPVLAARGGSSGGDASSYGYGTTTNNNSLNIDVGSTAGSGGDSYFSLTGASGGVATVTKAYGQSGNGSVSVGAGVVSGNGGSGYGGAGGAKGSDASIVNAVSGSTQGQLNLSQTAIAGAGGGTQAYYSNQAAAYSADGGNAKSILNIVDNNSNDLRATVSATGGAGGITASNSVAGGNGGDATAIVSLESNLLKNSPTYSNGFVGGTRASAYATAGKGGASPNYSLTKGLTGAALASATSAGTGVYGEAYSLASVSGSNNTATATSISSSDSIKPAVQTSASATAQSSGDYQTLSDATYHASFDSVSGDGSGFYRQFPTSAATATISALPNYSIYNVPNNAASLIVSNFEARGDYQSTQNGISTVTDTIKIEVDLSKLTNFQGNLFLYGSAFATGTIFGLTESRNVTLSGNIETWTILFSGQLAGPGSSFDFKFTAYDPQANPNLDNFKQTFNSASELNSFYAGGRTFDLGLPSSVSPSSVPLPGSIWLLISGLVAMVGNRHSRLINRSKCLNRLLKFADMPSDSKPLFEALGALEARLALKNRF